MKKIKQAIAILIAAALLLEPFGVFGTMKTVQAAEATKVYEQMKVTGISIRPEAEGMDKDALEIGDAGVKLFTDVTVETPEGWAVSEIEVGWYSVGNDDYYDFVSQKYDISAKPENNVYSLEKSLHKYAAADIYYLSDIYVKIVDIAKTSNYYELYGEPSDYYKVASESNPIKLDWYIEDQDWEVSEELESTDYTGTADYTILKTTGKDSTAPKVTAVKMKTTGTLGKNTLTEINVTTKESGSGIQAISIFAMTSDWEEMELLSFEAEAMEKYTGIKTITVKADSELLKYRNSGKYIVSSIVVQDYAGNTVEYVVDENNQYLVSETYVKNEDGTIDEVTHKIKTTRYNVCNGHVYTARVTKATTSANGNTVKKCKYCDAVKAGSKKTIYKIKSVKLSKTSYIYDGKVKKPTVTVYNSKGNKIAASNYTVTYPSGCKNAGQYKVKIVFKNNYKGTVYKTFTIKPKGTSISSRSAGTKKFTVKWKKQATQTTGYQVRYSTSSKFKSYSTKTISNKNTISATIKNLKAKKKYYVKVRTYKNVKVNGVNKKIYSAWSGVKTVTTK